MNKQKNCDEKWMKTVMHSTHNIKIPTALAVALLSAAVVHASNLDAKLADAGYQLISADFDGDQKADLLWQGASGREHELNLSSGAPAQRWRDGFLGLDWSHPTVNLAIGDFNGDAANDVFLQSKHPGMVSQVMLAEFDGKFGRPVQSIGDYHQGLRWDAEHHRLIVGDFDGDMRDDLFLQGTRDLHRHGLALASKAGTFEEIAFDFDNNHLGLQWSAEFTNLLAGDFDGNGTTDLLLQPLATGELTVLQSKHSWFDSVSVRFSSNHLGQTWNAATSQLLIGDFNGDGRDDVFLLAKSAGALSSLIPADRDGFNAVQALVEVENVEQIRQVLVADFDANGTDDILLIYQDGTVASVLAQDSQLIDLTASLRSLGLLSRSATLRNYADNRAVRSGATANSTSVTSTNGLNPVAGVSPGPQKTASSPVPTQSAFQTVNAVGKLEGQAGVSGGAATYQIPIAVPPGRMGMQPGVSLSYSSRGGNGIAGMGWSLNAGQSSIHRCPATVAQDGYAVGVRLTNEDKLCLDGQRLTVVSGTYGASGAVYRTEQESFVKVTQSGALNSASSSFTVKYANGQTGTFNQTVIPTGVSVPSTWLLKQLADLHNNTMHFDYGTISNGEVLLQKVNYTGVGATPGSRYVQFTYEARPDVSFEYFAGGKSEQTKRLSKISTFIGPNGSDKVREYSLTYLTRASATDNTKRSLLDGVQECAFEQGTPFCLNPTTFQWSREAPTVGSPVALNLGDLSQKSLGIGGDLDGDGRSEITISPWTPVVTSQTTPQADIYFLDANLNPIPGRTISLQHNVNFGMTPLTQNKGDINRDGRQDWIGTNAQNQQSWFSFSANSSGGWSAVEVVNSSKFPSVPGPTPWSVQQDWVDLNGDGYIDTVTNGYCTNSTSSRCVKVHLHNQNRTDPAWVSSGDLVTLTSTTYQQNIELENASANDLNGDGLADIVLTHTRQTGSNSFTSTMRVVFARRIGSEFGYNPVVTATSIGLPATLPMQYFFADINGDGLADFLSAEYVSGSSGAFRWYVRFNKGGTFEARKDTGTAVGLHVWDSHLQSYFRSAMVVDHDGDGAQDILVPIRRVVGACVDLIEGMRELHYCDDQLQQRAFTLQAGTALPSGSTLALYDTGLYEWQVIRFNTTTSSVSAEILNIGLVTSLPSSFAGGPSQVDFNGDGQDEYFWHHRPYLDFTWGPNYMNSVSAYQSSSSGINEGPRVERFTRGTEMMIAVTDGFSQQASWQYTPLSGATSSGPQPFYEVPFTDAGRYAAADGQHFYFTSSMPAVSSFTQSNGLGDTWTTRYAYREAIYNAAGRGMQGFRQIIEDSPKGTRSTTTFAQKFPITSMVESAEVRRISDNRLLSQTTNTINWRGPTGASPDSNVNAKRDGDGPIDNKTYLPYVKHSTTQSYELNGTSLGTTTTSVTVDSNGNTSESITARQDSYVTEITKVNTSYTPDFTNWWPNKSTTSTTSKCLNINPCTVPTTQTNNQKAVTSTITHWADETRRLPQRVVSGHPSDTAQQVITQFAYDSYGNVTSTTISGGSGETALSSRSSSSDYAHFSGYFPRTITDASGATVTMDYSLAHGKVTRSEDPLNNVVTNAYDAFGRDKSSRLTGALRSRTTVTKTFDGNVAADGVANAKYKVITEQPGVSPKTTTWFDAYGRTLRSESEDPLLGNARKTRVITQYDSFGRVTKQSNPHFTTTTITDNDYVRFGSYDTYDRPASKTLPNDSTGLVITYTYNGPTTTVRVGPDTSYQVSRTKNVLGQWWSVTDQGSESTYGNGGALTTTFRYDAFGNPVNISRTPTGGTAIVNTASYNALGHKTQMTDPDRGTWYFTYNVAGELVKQRDAKGNRTWFDYDNLGRVTKRFEATTDTKPTSAIASWSFANTCINGVTPTATVLCSSGKTGEISKTYSYDREGLLSSSNITMTAPGEASKSYSFSQSYDGEGRPVRFTAPGASGLITDIEHNSYGFAEKLKLVNALGGAAAGTYLHDVDGINNFGSVTAESYGNGLDATRTYSARTSRITGVCVNANPGCNLNTAGNKQALNYGVQTFSDGQTSGYDAYGNLLRQENLLQAVQETFTYDRRQRLVKSHRVAKIGGGFADMVESVDYRYDQLGNLLKKSDHAAKLQYGSAVGKAPHQVGKTWADDAMTQLIADYVYDANGNLTSSTGANSRTLTYNHQQVPVTVTRGSANSTFRYDENNERYFEKHVEGGKTTKIWKLGKLFEYSETTEGGVTTKEEKHYVTSVAQLSYKPAQNGKAACSQWRYFHGDRLGSIETITGQTGQVLERRGFDPFGKVRAGNWMFDNTLDGSTATAKGLYSKVTTRGFTGHDHIDSVGLIHMNGRAYDPDLGRFTGVDPFMQAPLNSQSLNPYSYIMNNPLAGTDPTGYVSEDACGQDKGSCPKGQDQQQKKEEEGKRKRESGKGRSAGSRCIAGCGGSNGALANGASAKVSITVKDVSDASKIESEVAKVKAGDAIAVEDGEGHVVIFSVSGGTSGDRGTSSLTVTGSMEASEQEATETPGEIRTIEIFNPEGGFKTADEAAMFGFSETNEQYMRTATSEEIIIPIFVTNVTFTDASGNQTVEQRYFAGTAAIVPATFENPLEFGKNNSPYPSPSWYALAHTHPNLAGQNGFSGGARKTDIEGVKDRAKSMPGGMYLRAPDGVVSHMGVKAARTARAGDRGREVGRLDPYRKK